MTSRAGFVQTHGSSGCSVWAGAPPSLQPVANLRTGGSTSPLAVCAAGSRWVIGAVWLRHTTVVPRSCCRLTISSRATGAIVIQAPCCNSLLIPLHAGAWAGVGWLAAVPGFVCGTDWELVKNSIRCCLFQFLKRRQLKRAESQLKDRSTFGQPCWIQRLKSSPSSFDRAYSLTCSISFV